MSPPEPTPSPDALRELLTRPPLPALRRLARSHPDPVYLVGGAVRDALLERRVADLDVAVADHLEAFIAAVAREVGRQPSPIGDTWRDTHRLRWRDCQVDLARLVAPVEEDLRRRDFTVNAMALSLGDDGGARLLDPCGGLEDLRSRRLRCPHLEVLDEDPLRLLRAVRYATVLQGFELDPELEEAIRQRAASLDRVARERIQTEWSLLLRAPEWRRGLELSRSLGLLDVALVPIQDLRGVGALASLDAERILPPALAEDPLPARLTALLWGARQGEPAGQLAEELVQRRWPPSLARFATRAAGWARTLEDAGEETLARWALRDRDGAALAAVLAGAVARLEGREAPEAAGRLHRRARRAAEERWVTGDDLTSWGMEEGPELGRLLNEAARGQVRRRWPDRGAARSWAQERVAAHRREVGSAGNTAGGGSAEGTTGGGNGGNTTGGASGGSTTGGASGGSTTGGGSGGNGT